MHLNLVLRIVETVMLNFKMYYMRVIWIFIFISITSNAQNIDINPDTGTYQTQGVIEVEGLQKDKIYQKSLEWIALNYRSADDVIQFKNQDAGKIIAKGSFISNRFGKKGWIRHILVLDFKDGRYRYTFSDFAYYSPGSGELPFETKMVSKKKIIADTENDVSSTLNSLTDYLKKTEGNDDW